MNTPNDNRDEPEGGWAPCTGPKVPRLLTYAEAAELLGIAPRTVRTWVSDGKLKKYKSGDGQSASVKVTYESVAAHVTDHIVTSGDNKGDPK
jgi:excisionase family DNA binding protein